MSPYLCSETLWPNHYSMIYNEALQYGGIITCFTQEDVRPWCTWSPYILGCNCYPFISITASISPIVSSRLTHNAAGVLCVIIDGARACRHSGSDGWWGLCVTEPFPSKIVLRLHSLTSHCGYKLELVQLCVSFVMCDTLVSTSHSSGVITPPAPLMHWWKL